MIRKELPDVNDVTEQINRLEVKAFAAEVLHCFNSRGWNLYKIIHPEKENLGPRQVLERIVSQGAATDLEDGEHYCLIPICEQDSDWKKVEEKLNEMSSKKRGPYFVELTFPQENAVCTGVFFVEAIVFAPPFVDFWFNGELSRVKDHKRIFRCNVFSIEIANLSNTTQCLTMPLKK